jgi:hypothetical protein
MKQNIIKYFLLSMVSAVLLSACIKNDVKELGNAGSTFIKFLESPDNKIFFEPFSNVRDVNLVSLRRDVNSENELNKPATVNLRLDTGALRAYNAAHPSDTYELLPDSLFTLLGSGITKTGNLTYQVQFNPGEFSKEFMIGLNGAKWDLSKKYAMPFLIDNPGGLKISADRGATLTFISIKNQWDGIYSIEDGLVTRYTAPGSPANDALSGSIVGNPDLALATAGPTTLEITGLQWAVGNNSGVGGINNLRLTVDPNTNLVTMFSLGNPTLANWEGKENRYDPATKTFYLNFRWNPTANRREYSAVLKYKGPR